MSRPGVSIEAKARSQGELGGRLGKLSLKRQVASLALWPFLEQILGFLVATVDLVFTGRLAEGELRIAMLDAMALGGYTAWLLMIVQGSIGTGVMALVSRATGARDGDMARKGLTQGLLLGLVSGLIIAVLMSLVLPALVTAFGLTGEASRQARSYLGVLVWSSPFLGVMLSATNALRGAGDTKTPFFAMVLVNLVNIVTSWLFVFGPGAFGGHGVAGLALGSVLGWMVGALAMVLFLLLRIEKDQEEAFLSLRGAVFRPDRAVLTRIVRVGIPQSLEMGGMWAIQAVMVGFISSLPQAGSFGAHMIAIRVESMSFLPGFAIGSAGAALVGQYLGAGNPEMAMKAARLCWKYAALFMGFLGILFLLYPRELVAFIVPDGPDSLLFQNLAGPLVFLCGLAQPLLATALVLKTTMRGAGATKLVMRYSFTSMFFYRVLVVPLAVTQFGMGLTGIWVVMFLDTTTQALLFARVHFQGQWLLARV
ncbi:MATE family efflux transporter [Roseibacillus ishigakijimensis]|uniref:Multidrug-efflux transporter n=1 Tax=Roseibacillus ishigakijimensis TaxID=454146 RepID=A0A934RNU1_9BACT|nr:MATE family efflux transporter [Roseibacillus ishigakijimensis]MBK1834235.1 MATE family efflux transporter [Roseibacillus ishigakijimensis]